MSFRYLAWAQSHKTGSPTGKAVLLAICAIVNDDGEGFPSQQRIADDSELSIRTVKRAMDDLERAGYLSRTRRYREGGYRTSDSITVHKEPKFLGATMSGDTVSNLRCHSGLAEPVNEPVSNNNRGTRVPENFVPDESCQRVARENCIQGADYQIQLDAFMDYWRAIPGAKGRKLNWQGTFRNWLRNSKQFSRGKSNAARHTNPSPADFYAEMQSRITTERSRLDGVGNENG